MSEQPGSLGARMLGAATLSVTTFEDVEHDETATGQAAAVVIMVAAASAIGASGGGLIAATGAAVSALLGWLVWAGITYLVGARIFEGTATWGELLRTLGFAQAPGVLWIVGILPLTGWVLSLLLPLWMGIAAFIAVRQALDFGNAKTFFTILVGWGVYSALQIVF